MKKPGRRKAQKMHALILKNTRPLWGDDWVAPLRGTVMHLTNTEGSDHNPEEWLGKDLNKGTGETRKTAVLDIGESESELGKKGPGREEGRGSARRNEDA